MMAVSFMMVFTSLTVRFLCCALASSEACIHRATIPAATGVAIDVPSIMAYGLVLLLTTRSSLYVS